MTTCDCSLARLSIPSIFDYVDETGYVIASMPEYEAMIGGTTGSIDA
jgi:hypothetical protein